MMDAFISDSDWESSSESGCSDDQEELEYLYGGQASLILTSLEETIGKIDEFLSFQKGFMHGDIVRFVTDPSGQMGKVVGSDMVVDLENSHGTLLKDVNSKKLLKICSISAGDLVIGGSWVGRVDKIIYCVTVIFDDGAKCEITVMDREKLIPISTKILDDSQYPYYPGQRVKVKLSTLSTSAKWLCGTWKDKRDEGTIFAIDAGLVYVDWLASALTTCNSSVPAPPCLQNAKNLTLLSCFSQGHWQIGDWCLLPVEVKNNIMDGDFFNASTHKLVNEIKKLEFEEKNQCAGSGEIFAIVQTKTKVDVLWQDGSRTLGLDSKALLPTSAVNAHEFWPEQFVLEKSICDDPLMSSSQKWGIVQSVDAKEQTVKVQWKNLNLSGISNVHEYETEEIMSAYELIEHPDFSFCFGDVVFLSQNKLMGQFDAGYVKDSSKGEQGLDMKENNFHLDLNKHVNIYLSCIGIVTGFTNGAVEVKWATCSTTKVAPYEIYRVDNYKYEGSTTTSIAYEENLVGLGQELNDGENQGSKRTNLWDPSTSFLPRAAIGFFSSIASLFGSLGATLPSTTVSSCHFSEDCNEPRIFHDVVPETCDYFVAETNELDELHETSSKWEEEISKNKDPTLATFTENCDHFKQFEMLLNCPQDHHFINSGKGSSVSQRRRSWLKKVHQEWSILEKNHSETIYVRVFEERMDLIRAVIVGAPGTPYHDGLFFFDIYLPPAYPHEPPLFHYISGGFRVNPNLYESGNVCLSLLNTWTGGSTEVWNPESSTILQVLLSLQALVLNEKPYFNEAGYDALVGRAEGEKNSDSYNENAFLVTCKTMLYLLRKTPEHFEELVKEHFSQRSQYILMACKAYMDGAPIGHPCGVSVKDNENRCAPSTGFKIMLAKLHPKLVDAFSGLVIGNFLRRLFLQFPLMKNCESDQVHHQ